MEAYQRQVLSHWKSQPAPTTTTTAGATAPEDPAIVKKNKKQEKELYKQLFKDLPGT